jgi:hypothetical protein
MKRFAAHRCVQLVVGTCSPAARFSANPWQ